MPIADRWLCSSTKYDSGGIQRRNGAHFFILNRRRTWQRSHFQFLRALATNEFGLFCRRREIFRFRREMRDAARPWESALLVMSAFLQLKSISRFFSATQRSSERLLFANSSRKRVDLSPGNKIRPCRADSILNRLADQSISKEILGADYSPAVSS